MPLLPPWAPNLHPLVIHFPIVLFMTAAAIDLVDVVFDRPSWLGDVATSLYVLGAATAVFAYLTGERAGSTVLIPAMAHPFVADHRSWALVTTWYCAIAVAVRFAARRAVLNRARSLRALLAALGLIG